MKELKTKTLESDKLILRKFLIEDATGMFNNWATDPERCKFLTWSVHKDIDETEHVIQTWIKEYDEESLNWVVEIKETHEVIGSICALNINKRNKTVELGYCYGSRFWGKGYATEALRKVIEYLLTECDFYLVEADHMSENPASGRVMQKAGMHKDAVLRERVINKFTKERNDEIIYSITKNEL